MFPNVSMPAWVKPLGGLLILVCASAAAVVDRIAVVAGNTVITEGEVLEEVRLTQFLNRQPLDLGPAQRRAAAERLVDQQLIRKEMQLGGYAAPAGDAAETMLRDYRRENYPAPAEYTAALAKYGISEQQLKDHLLWQLTAIRFTDLRFRTGLPEAPMQTANRSRDGIATEPGDVSVDDQMDAWLKETRSRTRIDFKKEAFQ